MQRTAVLSDIHGNLEALEAVLSDLERQEVERLVVLGDTVGYGPNPRECLERIAPLADVLLVGNHEADLIEPDPDMDVDGELRQWTQGQLVGCPAWARLKAHAEAVGVEHAAAAISDGLHLVHGTPAAPIAQYLWPAHPCQYLVFNRQISERLTEFMAEFGARLGCCGHTHVPAVLAEYASHGMFDPYETHLEWNREKTFVSPQVLFVVPIGAVRLALPEGGRFVINPGSVGQPRDDSVESSYAIVDDRGLELRRVRYDLALTLQKLRALPISGEIIGDLALRLARGS